MSSGWLTSTDYYFNEIIEKHVEIIRNEFLSIVEKNLLVPYAHKKQDGNSSILIRDGWSGFLLKNKNIWIDDACIHAPETVKLLKSFPELETQQKGTYGFSVVHKNTTIFSHNNQMGKEIRHRHQLCIDPIHKLNDEELFLEVDGESRSWMYGKVISFDDGYFHSVTNCTAYDRAVLIYDSIPNLQYSYKLSSHFSE
jgi:aspartyl/asparaginyl beta-hydroxylase (cupin superfamily)